jgi:glutathione S-transferase
MRAAFHHCLIEDAPMGNPPVQPILYSFRRCPYAMRARMALQIAGIAVEHREVGLRDKPDAMLAVSPKGTVPVLVAPDGAVIDESLDIMRWALNQADPEQWLDQDGDADTLITAIDGPFKHHLDRMKYADRYPGADPVTHRAAGFAILTSFEQRLATHAYLAGEAIRLVDIASFPFIRQFARADLAVWQAAPLPNMRRWLDGLIASPLFQSIMMRHDIWTPPASGTTA